MTYEAHFFFFFSEHWKFNVDSINAKKWSKKIITTRILVFGSQPVKVTCIFKENLYFAQNNSNGLLLCPKSAHKFSLNLFISFESKNAQIENFTIPAH